MTIVSLREKRAVSSMLVLYFLLYLFLWIAQAFHVVVLDRVAAIAGILTAIACGLESFQLISDAPATTRLARRTKREIADTPHPVT
jgi:succinate-acetate transporter protein